MIYLIAGGSHSGKTLLAQKLLEAWHIPYLSIDHLKMGLIRSGVADLSPESPDAELTPYLWNVVREIIKTALENGQNLIVEGCYIPCHYAEDFSEEQQAQIRALWLILSEDYIRAHFAEIKAHASDIEHRIDDNWCTPEILLRDNRRLLAECRAADAPFLLIDGEYRVDAAAFERTARSMRRPESKSTETEGV